MMETYNCMYFDGEKLTENASVTIENGAAVSVSESNSPDGNCFIMPGPADTHVHISSKAQIETMMKYGVTAACDVASSADFAEQVRPFTLICSAGMTMGTLNGRGYVRDAAASGAKYIKVLLMGPFMPKPVLRSICEEAHELGLKVAVHATTVKAQKMSVEAGADILIHIPMEEHYPQSLAEEIAEKEIVNIPTLVMMENFCRKPSDIYNAMMTVKMLYDCGVTILTGTDANPGSFAPAVSFGDSLHREMRLLVQAGLTPVDVLAGATKKAADVFGFQMQGLLLVSGRPDRNISVSGNIQKMWI